MLHLLVGPYAGRQPVPIVKLAEMATDVVLGTFVFDRLASEHVAGRISWDVARIADALELAGVLRRSGTAEQEPEAGQPLPPGGDVELTPAGVAALQKRLPALGYDVPALAMLTDLGPELAVPQVRQLAENPASRGFALCWLADNGMLDVQALYDPEDPDSFA